MVGKVVRLVVEFQIMSFQIMSFHEMSLDCQFSWQFLAGRFRFSFVLLGLDPGGGQVSHGVVRL